VTKVAVSGQLLVAARGQIPMAANTNRVLDPKDARALLSITDRWTSHQLDGFVCFATTDDAPIDDPTVWFRDIPWLSDDPVPEG